MGENVVDLNLHRKRKIVPLGIDRKPTTEDEVYESARKALPRRISELPTLANDRLVEDYAFCVSYVGSDPRIVRVWMELGDAMKAEILRRLDER